MFAFSHARRHMRTSPKCLPEICSVRFRPNLQFRKYNKFFHFSSLCRLLIFHLNDPFPNNFQEKQRPHLKIIYICRLKPGQRQDLYLTDKRI